MCTNSDGSILDTASSDWTPLALVFEDKKSYIGRKVYM